MSRLMIPIDTGGDDSSDDSSDDDTGSRVPMGVPAEGSQASAAGFGGGGGGGSNFAIPAKKKLSDNFIASPNFTGERQGFVYREGPLGKGYYRAVKSKSPKGLNLTGVAASAGVAGDSAGHTPRPGNQSTDSGMTGADLLKYIRQKEAQENTAAASAGSVIGFDPEAKNANTGQGGDSGRFGKFSGKLKNLRKGGKKGSEDEVQQELDELAKRQQQQQQQQLEEQARKQREENARKIQEQHRQEQAKKAQQEQARKIQQQQQQQQQQQEQARKQQQQEQARKIQQQQQEQARKQQQQQQEQARKHKQQQEEQVRKQQGQRQNGSTNDSRMTDCLDNIGLPLPDSIPEVPGWASVSRIGKTLFVGAHGPVMSRGMVRGRLGEDMDADSAQVAAIISTLALLKTLKDECGSLNHIQRVARCDVNINCAPEFTDHHAVCEPIAQILDQVFGRKGVVVPIGANSLPGGACVQVSAVVELV